ncbi:trans-aconitate 2-methyltransferase [Agrobacterium sp. CG674]
MPSVWSPAQYLKFEDYRTRPAADLLASVGLTNPVSITDIGCGPGNSTELLVKRFELAKVTGIDSSPQMIKAASARLPTCTFETVDVSCWQPKSEQDLLFSNAVLQWVPDHDALLTRLVSFLRPGGFLALQMPDNLNEPAQVAMRTAASLSQWSNALKGAEGKRIPILSISDYWSLLKPVASNVEIWRTTYIHPLSGLDGIVEWFKGTGLLPYLSRLTDAQKTEYLQEYREILSRNYAAMDDGTVLLPFPRLFIVVRR